MVEKLSPDNAAQKADAARRELMKQAGTVMPLLRPEVNLAAASREAVNRADALAKPAIEELRKFAQSLDKGLPDVKGLVARIEATVPESQRGEFTKRYGRELGYIENEARRLDKLRAENSAEARSVETALKETIAAFGRIHGAITGLKAAGVNDQVTGALQSSFWDFTSGNTEEDKTAFKKRGEANLQAGEYYKQHAAAIRSGLLAPKVREVLEKDIVSLGANAGKGDASLANQNAEVMQQHMQQIKTFVADVENILSYGAAAQFAVERDMLQETIISTRNEALKEQMLKLKQDLDSLISRLYDQKESANVGEREIAMAEARILFTKKCQELIRGRDESEVAPQLAIMARGLESMNRAHDIVAMESLVSPADPSARMSVGDVAMKVVGTTNKDDSRVLSLVKVFTEAGKDTQERLGTVTALTQSAQLQYFMLSRYDSSDRATKKKLEGASTALDNGTSSISETVGFLSTAYQSRIDAIVQGRDRIRNPALSEKAVSIAENFRKNPPTTVEELNRLASTTRALEEIRSDEKRLDGRQFRGVKDGALAIYGRALDGLAYGANADTAFRQIELGRRYVAARNDPELSKAIEGMSAQLENATLIRGMDKFVGSGDPAIHLEPQQAAMRVLGAKDANDPRVAALLESYNKAGSGAEKAEDAAAKRAAFCNAVEDRGGTFIDLLGSAEGLSKTIVQAKRDKRGENEISIFKSAADSIRSLLTDMGLGKEVTSDRLRSTQGLVATMIGTQESMMSVFVNSKDPMTARKQLTQAEGVENVITILGRIRDPKERDIVAGIYLKGQKDISEGRYDDGVAQFSFAQAYATSRDRAEKDRIKALSDRADLKISADEASKLPLSQRPLSGDDARFLSRLYLDRTAAEARISDPKQKENYNAYMDLAERSYINGDRNGSEFYRNLADMYGRAAALKMSDPEITKILKLTDGDPSIGLPSLAKLKENMASDSPKSLFELFGFTAANAEANFSALNLRLFSMDADLKAAEFRNRKLDLENKTVISRLSASEARLKAARDKAERRGSTEEVAIYGTMAETTDVKWLRERLETSKKNYANGTEMLKGASGLRLKALSTADKAEADRISREASDLIEKGSMLIESAEAEFRAIDGVRRNAEKVRTGELGDRAYAPFGRSIRYAESIGETVNSATGEIKGSDITVLEVRRKAAASTLRVGDFMVQSSIELQARAEALLRRADELDAKNKKDKEKFANVTVPLAPGISGPRALAYDYEKNKNEIERGRKLAKSFRVKDASSALSRADAWIKLDESQSIVSIKHDENMATASKEERDKGEMDYFRTETLLGRIRYARTRADLGDYGTALRIAGEVKEDAFISSAMQHQNNIASNWNEIAKLADANAIKFDSFGAPMIDRDALLKKEIEDAKRQDRRPNLDAVEAQIELGNFLLKTSKIRENLKKDAQSLAAEARQHAADAVAARDSIVELDDIYGNEIGDKLVKAAVDLELARQARARTGIGRAAGLSGLSDLAPVADMDYLARLQEAGDTQGIIDYFNRNPALMAKAAAELKSTGEITEAGRLSLISESGNASGLIRYQDRMRGWRAAEASFDLSAKFGMNADMMESGKRRREMEVRVGVINARQSMGEMLALSIAAGEDPAAIGKAIRTGEKISLPSLRQENGAWLKIRDAREVKGYDDASAPGGGYRGGNRVEAGVDFGGRRLSVEAALREAIGGFMETTERINIGNGPGATADTADAKKLKAELGESNWNLLTGYNKSSRETTELRVSTTMAYLDVSTTHDKERPKLLNLTPAEQEIVVAAMQRADNLMQISVNTVMTSSTFLSADERSAISDAILKEATALNQVFGYTINGGRDAEGRRVPLDATALSGYSTLISSNANIVDKYASERLQEAAKDDRYVGYMEAGGKMIAFSIMFATGLGAPAAIAGFAETSIDFYDQCHEAGGYGGLTRGEAAAGDLGLLAAGLGGLSAGAGSMLEVLGAEAVAGSRALTISSRVLKSSTLALTMIGGNMASGGVQLYMMATAKGGNFTAVDYAFIFATGVLTPASQHAFGVLVGKSPGLRTRFMTGEGFGSTVLRGFGAGLFGISREQLGMGMRVQVEEMAYHSRVAASDYAMRTAINTPEGRALIANTEATINRPLTLPEKRALFDPVSAVELRLGRSLEPNEVIGLTSAFTIKGRAGPIIEIKDPQTAAQLVDNYHSFVDRRIALLPEEARYALDRIDLRASEMLGGRLLEPGEKLALIEKFGTRMPSPGEAIRYLETVRAAAADKGVEPFYSISAYKRDSEAAAAAVQIPQRNAPVVPSYKENLARLEAAARKKEMDSTALRMGQAERVVMDDVLGPMHYAQPKEGEPIKGYPANQFETAKQIGILAEQFVHYGNDTTIPPGTPESVVEAARNLAKNPEFKTATLKEDGAAQMRLALGASEGVPEFKAATLPRESAAAAAIEAKNNGLDTINGQRSAAKRAEELGNAYNEFLRTGKLPEGFADKESFFKVLKVGASESELAVELAREAVRDVKSNELGTSIGPKLEAKMEGMTPDQKAAATENAQRLGNALLEYAQARRESANDADFQMRISELRGRYKISDKEHEFLMRQEKATADQAASNIADFVTRPATPAEAIEGARPKAKVDKAMADAIWSRVWESMRTWIVGGERLAGTSEDVTTGMVVRTVDDWVQTMVRGGKNKDVVVITGDKEKLNQINVVLGMEVGDRAIDAYMETLSRAAEYAAYPNGKPKGAKDVVVVRVRTGTRSDETQVHVILPEGTGGEFSKNFDKAYARARDEVLAERMNPDHPKTLAPYREFVKSGELLVGASYHVGDVVQVKKANDGSVTATGVRRDGSTYDAFIVRPDGSKEFLAPTLRKTDAMPFSEDVKAKLGIKDATDLVLARNISSVRENETVSGIAHEIRIEITDPTVNEELKGYLKRIPNPQGGKDLPGTEKGLAEVDSNMYGVRGLNTFTDHYGTNFVINKVEEAVGNFAKAHPELKIKRLGTMKYIIEGGTKETIAALDSFVTGALAGAGSKLAVSKYSPTSEPLSGVSDVSALSHISNANLGLNWNGFSEKYAAAGQFIATVQGGKSRELIGGVRGFNDPVVQELVKIIEANPAIRTIEDLFRAIAHPDLLTDPSAVKSDDHKVALWGAFQNFISQSGNEMVAAIAAKKLAAESQARVTTISTVALAAGAEGLSHAMDAARLEAARARASSLATDFAMGGKGNTPEETALFQSLAGKSNSERAGIIADFAVNEAAPVSSRRATGRQGFRNAQEVSPEIDQHLSQYPDPNAAGTKKIAMDIYDYISGRKPETELPQEYKDAMARLGIQKKLTELRPEEATVMAADIAREVALKSSENKLAVEIAKGRAEGRLSEADAAAAEKLRRAVYGLEMDFSLADKAAKVFENVAKGMPEAQAIIEASKGESAVPAQKSELERTPVNSLDLTKADHQTELVRRLSSADPTERDAAVTRFVKELPTEVQSQQFEKLPAELKALVGTEISKTLELSSSRDRLVDFTLRLNRGADHEARALYEMLPETVRQQLDKLKSDPNFNTAPQRKSAAGKATIEHAMREIQLAEREIRATEELRTASKAYTDMIRSGKPPANETDAEVVKAIKSAAERQGISIDQAAPEVLREIVRASVRLKNQMRTKPMEAEPLDAAVYRYAEARANGEGRAVNDSDFYYAAAMKVAMSGVEIDVRSNMLKMDTAVGLLNSQLPDYIAAGKIKFENQTIPEGSKITKMRYISAAQGAFEIEVVTPTGEKLAVIVKAQDLKAEHTGSALADRASQIAAPEVLTNLGGNELSFHESPLNNSGGLKETKYGIMQHMNYYEGNPEIGNAAVGWKKVHMKTESATELASFKEFVDNNPALKKFREENPEAFWKMVMSEYGFTQTGLMSVGFEDSHFKNLWVMTMRISESDAAYMQSLGHTIIRDEKGPLVLRFGRIDTDTGGCFKAGPSNRGLDFNPTYQDYAHHSGAAVGIFMRMQEVDFQGMRPIDIYARTTSDLKAGSQRWFSEVGSSPEFAKRVEGIITDNLNTPIGLGKQFAVVSSSDKAIFAQIKGYYERGEQPPPALLDGLSDNVRFFFTTPILYQYINGRRNMPIDEFGRTALTRDAIDSFRAFFKLNSSDPGGFASKGWDSITASMRGKVGVYQ